jgi:hypothetical protein
VNFPGAGSGGRKYVEFRVPAVAAQSGVDTCVQWRWDPTARTLAMRTWPQGGALTSFRTIVSNVVPGAEPFVMNPANAQHPRQSLDVAVSVQVNSNSKLQSATSSFVARNSTSDSDGNADSEPNGISDRPTCSVSGLRP